ncbi:MAG: gephyrin-like molybdotransferase Glp [Promethearchaeati archaeon SRVP18_Atabeyarchaeia-1]
MKKDVFFKITALGDAFTQLQEFAVPILDSERVSTRDSLNRILSADVRSPTNVPHFERSSRDGYAVKSSDTFGAGEVKPIFLQVVGEVLAGAKANGLISKGECMRISTGAIVPRGADSVVMLEYTEEEADGVGVHRPTSPGENIIKIGSDVKAGDYVFRRGRKLSAFDSGALAALGFSEISVFRRPNVSIMSTGNELLSAGQELEEGKVYDINSVTIHQAVIESGAIPIDLGIFPDDPILLVSAINSALSSSDVILASGGTSKGPGDLLLSAIKELGEPRFLVHGIAIKPGKPTILASIKDKLLITLPGYPTSALVVYYVLVDPTIRKMAHEAPYAYQRVKAHTSTRFYSEIGRKEFKPCRITKTDAEGIHVEPSVTGSEAIKTLIDADGFIIIDEETEFVNEGQEVEFYVFPHRLGEVNRISGGPLWRNPV